jgi:hypothetical protein
MEFKYLKSSLRNMLSGAAPKTVEYAPRQIFSEAEIFFPHYGRWTLVVPPGSCALLHNTTGQFLPYKSGIHRLNSLPKGPYTLRYVNICSVNMPLQVIKAQTVDSLTASLQVIVIWRVATPVEALKLTDPYQLMEATATEAVVDLIQSHKQEELTPLPGQAALQQRAIARELINKLRANGLPSGLEIVNVIVNLKGGDPHIVAATARRISEENDIQQEKLLRIQQHSLDLQKQDQALAAEKKRQDIEVEQARTIRTRQEEEDLVRIQKAKNSAIEDEHLNQIRLRKAKLEMQLLQQKNKHVEELERIRMVGTVASALMQNQATPGIMRPMDSGAQEALVEMVKTLAGPAKEKGAPSWQERVGQELANLSLLGPFTIFPSEESDDDGIILTVGYGKLLIHIEIGPDYPNEAPRSIKVGPPPKRLVNIKWSPERNLREVVLEVANWVRQTSIPSTPGGGRSKG